MATKAPDLLRRFRKTHGLSLRDAAEALGITHPTLMSWESNDKTPRECYRQAIERWTNGAVPANAWPLSKHEARAQQNAAHVQPLEMPASKPAA